MRTRTSRRVVHPDDSSRFSDTSSLGSDISSDGSTDVDMNGTDVDPPTAITSTAASHDECSSDEGGDEKLALSIRNDVRRVATPHPCRFEDEEARIIGIGERMEVPQVQPLIVFILYDWKCSASLSPPTNVFLLPGTSAHC